MSEVLRWQLKGFVPGVEGVSNAAFKPWVVMASDYDAAPSRENEFRAELESIKASIDGYDSPEHAAQIADTLSHQIKALESRMCKAEKRAADLVSILERAVMQIPNNQIKLIGEIFEALNPGEDRKIQEHICPGCGKKGWTASCGQCVPF